MARPNSTLEILRPAFDAMIQGAREKAKLQFDIDSTRREEAKEEERRRQDIMLQNLASYNTQIISALGHGFSPQGLASIQPGQPINPMLLGQPESDLQRQVRERQAAIGGLPDQSLQGIDPLFVPLVRSGLLDPGIAARETMNARLTRESIARQRENDLLDFRKPNASLNKVDMEQRKNAYLATPFGASIESQSSQVDSELDRISKQYDSFIARYGAKASKDSASVYDKAKPSWAGKLIGMSGDQASIEEYENLRQQKRQYEQSIDSLRKAKVQLDAAKKLLQTYGPDDGYAMIQAAFGQDSTSTQRAAASDQQDTSTFNDADIDAQIEADSSQLKARGWDIAADRNTLRQLYIQAAMQQGMKYAGQ